MLRSAAKNFEDVTVLWMLRIMPACWKNSIRREAVFRGKRGPGLRARHLPPRGYDSAISTTLQKIAGAEFPEALHLNYRRSDGPEIWRESASEAALYRNPVTAGRG